MVAPVAGQPGFWKPDTATTQRSNFTMVPNILIDAYDEMSDACRFGFIKFMRLVRKDGCFVGSLRKLGKKLKIANMTINRMVRAWEHFVLVAIERIEDTDLFRITPKLDSLWGANTDHYMYAPVDVVTGVTICDTITITDTSATDRVVTFCDDVVTKCDNSVTNCDTVSQPQAQNDPQYITNISNKREENISLTSVSDSRTAYAKGYQRQDIVGRTSLLGDDFDLDALQEQMSISYPPVDMHSHSHAPAIGDEEAAQPTSMQPHQFTDAGKMATTEPALQAKSTMNDTTSKHATMSSDTLFPASIPVSREAVKVASTKETKKPPKNKKVVPLDLLSSASPRAQQIIADWQAIFKSPQPITKLLIEAAEALAPCNPTAEDLRACRLWLYKTDTKSWYRQHGMCLNDIARNWEKWQSAQEAPPVEVVSVHSNGKVKKASVPYGMVMWQGALMTWEAANDLGWNGGFEKYN